MDSIREFFMTQPYIAWSIVATLSAMLMMAVLWEQIKWWWIHVVYKFPFIGKLKRLAKGGCDPDETGFTSSEKALCSDFTKFMGPISREQFENATEYLRKAEEIDRRPMPSWAWILIVTLVLLESLGFSYVLAGFTIPGASENLQQIGALGISLLLSILLVGFTHWAGHEIYVSKQIASARRDWKESGRGGPLRDRLIVLNDDQYTDDDKSHYTQKLNRYTKTRAAYPVTIITTIMIIVIAIGATYVRGQVLEKQLTMEAQIANDNFEQPMADMLDLTGSDTLPSVDAQSSQQADQLAQQQIIESDKKGGWGTFIVLAFIFVFIQIFGILLGFRFGFGASQSREAFGITCGFSTYEEAQQHNQVIIDAAEAMLSNLQSRMADHCAELSTQHKGEFNNTCRDYLRLRAEETLRHDRQIESIKGQHKINPDTPADNPITGKTDSSASHQAAYKTTDQSTENALRQVYAQFKSLAGKPDEQDSFFLDQPNHVQEYILQEQQAEKERLEVLRRMREQ